MSPRSFARSRWAGLDPAGLSRAVTASGDMRHRLT